MDRKKRYGSPAGNLLELELVPPVTCLRIAPCPRRRFFSASFSVFYLIAISIGMLVGRRRTLATLDEMARSGPWTLFSGMVATAAGLAVVLVHDVWSGGALAIAVTLAGWMGLLTGGSPGRDGLGLQVRRLRADFYASMGAVLVLGLWMAVDAFGG
jgi:hypothetical protein